MTIPTNSDPETNRRPITPIRNAVILAAGRGIRLEERGKQTPKCRICLGERSILEESISRMAFAPDFSNAYNPKATSEISIDGMFTHWLSRNVPSRPAR
jgi:hypothetical protein